jgi:hypothetical protein
MHHWKGDNAMRIVHDFHLQVRRVAPRKRKGEITRYDRQRLRHVIGWLEFCGRKYRLERITQLRQDHYTAYMRELNRCQREDKSIPILGMKSIPPLPDSVLRIDPVLRDFSP